MESATLRRSPPVLPQLLRLGLLALLLLLALIAWATTNARMRGMDAGPGTDPGALGFFLVTWVVMMSAMMFPSISPMVLMYARMAAGQRERGKGDQTGTTAFFVGGYLITWTAAGLAGYAIYELGRSLSIDAFSWDRGGPYLAGTVLIGAAAYQLTPLKDACLRKCRNPLMYLLESWLPGRVGALRMGVEHGAWCVGCCWALMAALFALGVMSLGWMALVAALIAAEKLLPRQALASAGVAVLLLVLGLGVAFAPASVPGLTQPGSPQAMQSMDGSMQPTQPSMEE
jgi:predicted metal-binding membrane protein